MVAEETYKQLLREIPAVERSYSLKQFNALGAAGSAAYFCTVTNAGELAAAVKAAIDCALPYEIVGTGSSVLFPDEEFAGLVIHNEAAGFVLATDRSQMVVESGMSLRRFITLAASRGYGGMTQFYNEPGTVGGALYHGLATSFVRQITLLSPPTRMKPYPTVIRQKPEWLVRTDGQTRLQELRASKGYGTPLPVILNVQFQLTSVRPDEIQRRLQKESEIGEDAPSGAYFGPLFKEVDGLSLKDILHNSGAHKLSAGSVKPDRHYHNYLRGGRDATATQIWECAEKMRQQVRDRSGIELAYAFERFGV